MSVPGVDPDVLRVYRRLLGYARPHLRVLALAMLAMVIYAATDSGFALLMQPLLRSLEAGTAAASWLLPLMVLGLFVTRALAGFGADFALGWVGRQVIKQMRTQVFSHLVNLPTRYYDQSSSGMLLSKLTYNIEQVAESTSNVLTILIRDTLTILGLVAVMIYLSPTLSLFIAVVAPTIAVLIRYLSKLFRRYSSRIQNSMGDVTRVAEQAISGHRVIKVFNGQNFEEGQFEVVNERNRSQHMKLVLSKSLGDSATQFLAALGVAGVIFVATLQSAVDAIDPARFVAFLSAMLLLMAPLKRLTNVNVALQRGIAAGETIFELLDEHSEHDTGTRRLERARGDIAFEQVSFTYDQAKGPVLRDIDLVVPAGQTLAIVGRSGSGKSTLVSLLPRFYDIDGGRILLDGHDVREYRLADLRRQIALVSQDVTLFNDTIARNIAYGLGSQMAREDIERAAEVAHVSEFIDALPNGLDTLVGDRGVLLSGGQRQRIAIARAVLKNAPILILDEATSALDTESERHIQLALEALMRDRTTLVIAHRLSTVEKAHRIIVMEAGKIAECGSHTQLLESGGQYAALHRMQFAEA